MSTQQSTIEQLAQRLQVEKTDTNTFKIPLDISEPAQMPYYLLTCKINHLIRLCKGAVWYIEENKQGDEVSLYDVLAGLEIAEKMNEVLMEDVEILDKLAKHKHHNNPTPKKN